MTTDTLKRILELAERATPGPWKIRRSHEGYDIGSDAGVIVDDGGMHLKDAAFVASANPTLVANLIRLALAARSYQQGQDDGEFDAALAAVFGEGDDHA